MINFALAERHIPFEIFHGEYAQIKICKYKKILKAHRRRLSSVSFYPI